MATTSSTSTASSSLRTMAQQLMATDRKPLERMQAEKAELQERGEALQTLGSRLSSLRTLAASFLLSGAQNPLRKLQVSGGDDQIVRATLGGAAMAGEHAIEVVRLAGRHALASEAVTGGDPVAIAGSEKGNGAASSGTVRFRLTAGGTATEYTAEIEAGATRQQALRSLAAAINAGGGVRASVLDRGDGRVSLLLQAAATGAAGRITGIEDLEGGWMRALGLGGGSGKPAATGTVEEAADALVRVDGVEVVSPENTLVDVLPGISLTLRSVGGPVRIAVDADADGTIAEIRSFIEQYNQALDEVRDSSRSADETGANRGIFAGDLAVVRLRSRLRSAVTGSVAAADGTLSSLADLGITTDREVRLSLNSEKTLRAAIAADAGAVEAVFSGEEGIGARLKALLGEYAVAGGVISRQSASVRTRISSIDRRVERANEALERKEAQLIQQLAQMEATIGSLSRQQQYLSGLLASGDSLYL